MDKTASAEYAELLTGLVKKAFELSDLKGPAVSGAIGAGLGAGAGGLASYLTGDDEGETGSDTAKRVLKDMLYSGALGGGVGVAAGTIPKLLQGAVETQEQVRNPAEATPVADTVNSLLNTSGKWAPWDPQAQANRFVGLGLGTAAQLRRWNDPGYVFGVPGESGRAQAIGKHLAEIPDRNVRRGALLDVAKQLGISPEEMKALGIPAVKTAPPIPPPMPENPLVGIDKERAGREMLANLGLKDPNVMGDLVKDYKKVSPIHFEDMADYSKSHDRLPSSIIESVSKENLNKSLEQVKKHKATQPAKPKLPELPPEAPKGPGADELDNLMRNRISDKLEELKAKHGKKNILFPGDPEGIRSKIREAANVAEEAATGRGKLNRGIRTGAKGAILPILGYLLGAMTERDKPLVGKPQ